MKIQKNTGVFTKNNKMAIEITLNRYDRVIKKLQKAPATFEEIYDHLNLYSDYNDNDLTTSKRTFQRDIKGIFKQFGIEIKCNRNEGYKYYIEKGYDEIINNRLLESYQIHNAINLSKQFETSVFFESRKPSGIEHFNTFLHAIKNNLVAKFIHQKYYEVSPASPRQTR